MPPSPSPTASPSSHSPPSPPSAQSYTSATSPSASSPSLLPPSSPSVTSFSFAFADSPCFFLLSFPAFCFDVAQSMGKKWQEPAKKTNLCLAVLREPGPDVPNSFYSGCGVPWRTQRALTCACIPRWQGTTRQMSLVSNARDFTQAN